MKALTTAVAVVGGFLGLLNMLGGIISGIWLAVLGEWHAIGWGVLGFVASHFVLSLALLPCVALGLGAAKAAEHRSWIGSLTLGTLSNLYVAVVMTAWAVAVMVFFLTGASARSWVPMLLWSYGVAIGPWAYMAQKESEDGGGLASRLAVFFAGLGYVVMMVVAAFSHAPTPLRLASVFGAVMLVNVIFQSLIAAEALREAAVQSDPWQTV